MTLRTAVFLAGLFVPLSTAGADVKRTEVSFSAEQTYISRHRDPTYTTGDLDTFNSFGIYAARRTTDAFAFDVDLVISYNSRSGTEVLTGDARVGFNSRYSASDQLDLIPNTGIDYSFARLKSEAPSKEIREQGFYYGLDAVYHFSEGSLEVFAHYSESTIDQDPTMEVGLGAWLSSERRLRLSYVNEGWIERIKGTVSFMF